MLPRLTGSNIAELIRNWRDLWNNRIITEFRRLHIVAGPGIRIDHRVNGTVISATGGSSSARAAGQPVPLFAVTRSEEQKIDVAGGFVNRNGIALEWWEGQQGITLAPGYVCICSEPTDKKWTWSKVTAMIRPGLHPCAFPVAEIKTDGTIVQYQVTVAMIAYSRRCPIAEL